MSFLDQVVEHEFLTSSARQIIIFAATAEQLIDQLMRISPTPSVIMPTIHWRCQLGQITRARANKLKEALNGLVQNLWCQMDLEGLETFKEHEGQPLIHLVQVQEEPDSCGTRVDMSSLPALLGLFFPNATRIKSHQFILLIK